MAHIEKFKASGVGNMLHHYERDREGTLERSNIDRDRTHLNYQIGIVTNADGAAAVSSRVNAHVDWNTVAERMRDVESATGKKVRKDAVVMADMVVTAPKNLRESDQEKFFRLSYLFLARKVGKENMLPGYVHMDETTPHMHAPFMPIKDGKFNYNGLMTRNEYRKLHKELGKFVDERLGYHVDVELSDKADKQLSKLSQKDYIEAKKALEEQQKRSVELDSEIDVKRGDLADLSIKKAELDAQIEEQQQRLESLRQEGDCSEARVTELESAVADTRRYEGENRAGKVAILEKLNSWGAGFYSELAAARAELAARVRELAKRVESLMPKPMSLAEQVEQATEAAHAINSREVINTRSRSIGR